MGKILALEGKGGVGKTTICSAIVRILGEKFPGSRILAIDADPAVGLATALGVEVRETLDDVRREIIERAEAGAGKEAVELLGEVRFRIFDALVETDSFAFLAIGRPEGAGCYCAVNAYLKEVIEMVSRDFDYVVIDGEAGIEQINRRVMDTVTHLFLVTDASKKGFQVIQTIQKVADQLVAYEKCGVIVNRVEDVALLQTLLEQQGCNRVGQAGEEKGMAGIKAIGNVPIVSVIGSDSAHARNDVLGRTIFELPADAPVYCGAKEALEHMCAKRDGSF